jgi:hypothetical protein
LKNSLPETNTTRKKNEVQLDHPSPCPALRSDPKRSEICEATKQTHAIVNLRQAMS